MQLYNSKKLIDDLQQQTNSFLETAVTKWQMASQIELLQQPAENKWSAAQCLEHLNSYGRYYLPEIEKAIEKAKQNQRLAKTPFKPGRLGNYFTMMMVPDGEGKKMKKMSAPKGHRPVANLNSDEVLREFIDQQERIIQLLEEARKIDLEKTRVAISIATFIKLKLGDTFRFLIMHNYRHMLQAERAFQSAAIKGGERSKIADCVTV